MHKFYILIFMLENKQSHRHLLYNMTSVVLLFAYPIKFVEYLDKEESCKSSPEEVALTTVH